MEKQKLIFRLKELNALFRCHICYLFIPRKSETCIGCGTLVPLEEKEGYGLKEETAEKEEEPSEK